MKISMKMAQEVLKKNPIYRFSKGEVSKKRMKKIKQERKKYGFSFEECWNLNDTIASFVLPRLIMFRKRTDCCPSKITFEEWKDILDTMIEGFYLIVDKKSWELRDEELEKAKKGIELFSKYFFSLWD